MFFLSLVIRWMPSMKSFSKRDRDLSLVSNELPIDFLKQVAAQEWMPVIDIARSKHKIEYLSFVIDDEVQLESEEPANTELAFGSQPF